MRLSDLVSEAWDGCSDLDTESEDLLDEDEDDGEDESNGSGDDDLDEGE